MLPTFLRSYTARFQKNDACDELKTIGYSMTHLFQKRVLLMHQFHSVRYIFDGEQHFSFAVFIFNLTRTDKHIPLTETFKIMHDFEPFDRLFLRKNFF